MSPEHINPFDKPLQNPVPSDGVARRLLGRTGVELFYRVHQQEKTLNNERDFKGGKILLTDEARALKESRELQPGEFIMDVPSGNTSPTAAELRDTSPEGYRLDSATRKAFLDCPFSDLALTSEVLDGMTLDNMELRARLLGRNQASSGQVVAKVISIATEPDAESLSTKDVLLMMDARGYRPATVKELLAYAKMHWKPEREADISDEEERQLASSQVVAALGSSHLGSGIGCFPLLNSFDERRFFQYRWFDENAASAYRYLFIRK